MRRVFVPLVRQGEQPAGWLNAKSTSSIDFDGHIDIVPLPVKGGEEDDELVTFDVHWADRSDSPVHVADLKGLRASRGGQE